MKPMKRVGRMKRVRNVHTGHTATARLEGRRHQSHIIASFPLPMAPAKSLKPPTCSTATSYRYTCRCSIITIHAV